MSNPKVVRIFFDTEFTDFTNMDMISIGMVAESGEELYKENLDFIQSWSSQWVKDNIYPLLDRNRFGAKRYQIVFAIEEFVSALDADEVEFWADYQGDLDILKHLLESAQLSKPYKLVNFRNVIYCAADKFTSDIGGTDTSYQKLVQKVMEDFKREFERFFAETGQIQHHALSDARANIKAFRAAMWENHLAV